MTRRDEEYRPPTAAPPTVSAQDDAVRVAMQLHLGGATSAVQVPEKGTGRSPEAPPEVVAPARIVGPTLSQVPQDRGLVSYDAKARPAFSPGLSVADLPTAAQRCRLKGEACRWGVERRKQLADRPDFKAVAPRDADIISRAKALPNCYLWVMDPYGPDLPADDVLTMLAGCYDVLGQALELVARLTEHGEKDVPPATTGDALNLLAEAQSALRSGLRQVDEDMQDRDQQDVFLWLRNETRQRNIYIGRFMRVDDPAAPETWPLLQARVEAFRDAWDRRQRRDRGRQSLLSKAKYHANRVARAAAAQGTAQGALPAAPPVSQALHDEWVALSAVIEQLVADGMPPSDTRLRDLLLPFHESLPDPDAGREDGGRDVAGREARGREAAGQEAAGQGAAGQGAAGQGAAGQGAAGQGAAGQGAAGQGAAGQGAAGRPFATTSPDGAALTGAALENAAAQPTGFGPGVRAVLAEVDRYLAGVSRDAADAEAADRQPEAPRSPEIREVSDLLRGQRVVLIGGLRRPHAQRALERSFELEELIWPSTDPHESLSTFEPHVARPDVAVVLLAIRWSSHSYGELQALCDKYGKPFVRLPAGYNPQQVARQILQQRSDSLRGRAAG